MNTNCYNSMEFFGNKKVHKLVGQWRKQLESFQKKGDQYRLQAVQSVFNLDGSFESLGTDWIYLDAGEILVPDGGIGFVSSVSPPTELQKRMASLLCVADHHVIVRNTYTLFNGSVGISYATPYDSETVYFEDAFVDLDDFYSKYEESVEAEEQADIRLKDLEREYVWDMMSDMPGTIEVVRTHIKDVNIDWVEFDNRLSED